MIFKVLIPILLILLLQNVQAISLITKCGEYHLQGHIRKKLNSYSFVIRLYEKSNSEIELPLSTSNDFKIIPYQDRFVNIKATISDESNMKKLMISKIDSIHKVPINYLDEKNNPTIKLIENKKCD